MEIDGFLFKEKNFLYLWLAQVFSQTAISTINCILTVKAYNIVDFEANNYGISPNLAVSLIIGSYGLAALLFGIPSGILVDYIDRKKCLFVSTIARLVLVSLLLLFPVNLLMLVLFTFLLNTISQVFYPAEAAIIPIIVKKDKLLTANSIYTTSYFVSFIMGFVMGGIALAFMNFSIVLLIIALFFSISAISIKLINYPNSILNSLKLADFMPNMFINFVDSIKLIRTHFSIKISLIYLGIVQIVFGVFWALQPGLSIEVINIELRRSGLYIMTPVVIGVLIGSVLLNRLIKKYKENFLVELGIIGSSLSFLGIYILADYNSLRFRFGKVLIHKKSIDMIARFDKFLHLPDLSVIRVAIILFIAIGIFSSFILIIYNAKLQSSADKNVLGRIYGILQTLITVSGALPVMISGYLADRIGIGQVFVSIALFILILHFLLKYKYKSHIKANI